MTYARWHFQMTKPQEAGKSRMQIAMEIKAQTGVISSELRSAPSLMTEIEYLWRWFVDLARGRRSGTSANPINWTEVQSYFSLYGISPRHWELDAIRALDDAWMESRLGESKSVVTTATGIGKVVKNG